MQARDGAWELGPGTNSLNTAAGARLTFVAQPSHWGLDNVLVSSVSAPTPSGVHEPSTYG